MPQRGVKPSVAAVIVENAFREILGFSDSALMMLDFNQKFDLYCDQDRLDAMIDFIRTDADEDEDGFGGLPSLKVPRTIRLEFVADVTPDSKIGLLVDRISSDAEWLNPIP